ncbi:MAG: hypothetical protein RL427_318 [Bacteroidota bacterium]|jgi:hypothetical protein
MKKILLLAGVVFLSLQFSSCNPNDGYSGLGHTADYEFAQNFGAKITRDFVGQIVDGANQPIQNVTVAIGTTTTQTDANGVFIINGASVRARFAYITAKKVGYIDGSRTMVPTDGKNHVKIMMLENAPQQTIQSGVASEVSIYSGTKVAFDGAFKDETGADYTGAVAVALFHLTPSEPSLEYLMPGMLFAQTAENKQASLSTFGMLNVELRGADGQKLNLADGHTAEITMRIDDDQLATAPESIPLWHFDVTTGYWKEDGLATKVGNYYVGTVSHFSWWNCDMPNSSILLTFTFVNSDGQPLSNLGINMINASGYHASGSTDNNGQLSGILPANQAFTVNVYSPFYSCDSGIIYTTTVGPYTADTIIPNIVVPSSVNVESTTVTGTLLKCDNTNVTNGYVLLTSNAGVNAIATVTNGSFSFNELYCSSNTQFSLIGFDYDAFQSTGIINYNFTAPTTAVGILTACTAVNEFISYQIDSNPQVIMLTNINAFSGGIQGAPTGGMTISASAPTGGIYFTGNTVIPGVYTSADFSIEGGEVGYIGATTTNTVQFNLSNYGNVGEYIDMTFYGTYFDPQQVQVTPHTITGTIHVLRDN